MSSDSEIVSSGRLFNSLHCRVLCCVPRGTGALSASVACAQQRRVQASLARVLQGCCSCHFGRLVVLLLVADFAVGIDCVGHGELRATVGRTWEAAYRAPRKWPAVPKKSSGPKWLLSQVKTCVYIYIYTCVYTYEKVCINGAHVSRRCPPTR